MYSSDRYDIAIVGAGIVGASTALWLQADQRRVLLLDRAPPGSGTSFGNACTLAHYGCVPINSPGIIRRLPRLMFSGDSPLRIDWWYAMRNLPWQISFLRNCSKQRVDYISTHLGNLLALTDKGIDPLLARCGGQELISSERGCIYIFSTRQGFESAAADTEVRRRHGAEIVPMTADEFRQLEPGVKLPIYRALSFEGTRFLRDPQGLVSTYVARFIRDGGEFSQIGVSRVRADSAGVELTLDNGSSINCNKLVVAAGAWSKSVSGSGAEDLPLDTERGYHILFRNHGDIVKRPVAWIEGGFYATPMAHGLRMAGTVELAGLNPNPTPERIDYLSRKAYQLFGDIGPYDEQWLGFRPTFPDALPVIGPSHRSGNIMFAFGHQHLGLTLGGATGMLIAQQLAGADTAIDLSPFRADRFFG